MGSLMHRAQDRAPVVRSKGREKEPRGQATWIFHQRKILQLAGQATLSPHCLSSHWPGGCYLRRSCGRGLIWWLKPPQAGGWDTLTWGM